MSKTDWRIVVTIVALVVVVAIIEATRPTPINWTPTYSKDDAIPFGDELLFDLLPEAFPEQEVSVVRVTPYELLKDDPEVSGSYILQNTVVNLDEQSSNVLLDFVARGNYVFLAAEAIQGALADTLNVRVRENYLQPLLQAAGSGDENALVNFANPRLSRTDGFSFRRGAITNFIASYDTSATTVLGWRGDGTESDQVNFIKTQVGDGAFLISSIPRAFTNYGVVSNDNARYVFTALSYLPVTDVLWDEYYKVGRLEAQTPLRVILRRSALRAAWWTGLIALALWLIMGIRRRQRIIPEVKPPANSSLSFANTIGRLYLKRSNHAAMLAKREAHLQGYIRDHLGIQTSTRDASFLGRVARKSGVALDDVAELFARISKLKSNRSMTNDQLVKINRSIDDFYRKAKS